ncbi:DUF799 family lipoprotein [Acetobacteraceae bacterium ESL0709]|nr:DUF799 family lipoprotein [Acetobacteraceae bacterium ESL0697]MDF7678401.1 DUF799 family lipoprotein [Acetobacteraceae bacterium ESL0709]
MRQILHLSTLLALSLVTFSSARAELNEEAFRKATPRSILVMPPVITISGVSSDTDGKIASAFMSQIVQPLAEGGYYVTPIVNELETFRHSSARTPDVINKLPAQELYNIFSADTALYTHMAVYNALVKVWRSYGINGDFPAYDVYRTCDITETLVDLKTGQTLWEKKSFIAGSDTNKNKSFWGEVNMSLTLLGDIATFTTPDKTYLAAGPLTEKALAIGQKDGLPYGPLSPRYREK